jgi:hypothetical protein
MYGKPVGACLFEGFGISFRLFDHQVDIKNFCGRFTELGDHRKSEADIGYESSIHYVQVKPVGFAFIKHLAFVFQPEKIGCQ